MRARPVLDWQDPKVIRVIADTGPQGHLDHKVSEGQENSRESKPD